jgi:hypothetical protein
VVGKHFATSAALATFNYKHGRLFLAAFALGSGQLDGLKPTSSETALSSY